MIYKVYLKNIKEYFLLPMKPDNLFDNFKSKGSKHAVKKSNVNKVNPITSVKNSRNEDLENIIVENQRTSIFLFNLLLLVNKKNNKQLVEHENYTNAFILSEIEKTIGVELQLLKYEEQEKVILEYLNKTEAPKKETESSESQKNKGSEAPKDDSNNSSEDETETSEGSYFDKVVFNTSWIKNAQRELKEKKEGKKNDKNTKDD